MRRVIRVEFRNRPQSAPLGPPNAGVSGVRLICRGCGVGGYGMVVMLVQGYQPSGGLLALQTRW